MDYVYLYVLEADGLTFSKQWMHSAYYWCLIIILLGGNKLKRKCTKKFQNYIQTSQLFYKQESFGLRYNYELQKSKI